MYGNKLSNASLLLALTLCSLMAGALLINPAFAAIVSLGEALDNTTITWITSGSNGMVWYGQTTTPYYGGDSAQSGDIGDNQFSSLRFDTGYVSYYYGMYVRFVWRVSSEATYDKLCFYIDYDLMDSISGEVGWQTKTYYIPGPPTGYHTLEWEYTKDGSVSAGADAGWVDHVEILSGVRPMIDEAVDNTALTWQTFFSGSGWDPYWKGETFISVYGGDAAQSGAVSTNSYSYLRTSVTGPGTLKFYWKVSSGTGDYLIFYIDNVAQNSIGGNVDWQQKTFTIPSGLHTLQWNYAKDMYSVADAGSDCGWVDKVEFTADAAEYSATIWGWDYIQGWQIPVPIAKDGVSTGYSTPHTFTGLTGTHTFTVPNTNSAGHPFSDWSTDWTDETITVSSDGTYTARYRAGYSATIWSWCAIEGWLSSSIAKDGVSTGYSTPHTFTGLTGTHTFTVPNTDASGHTFYEWSTGWTGPTLTVSSAGVYTARYKPGAITLTSPNGGENWVRGTVHSITWTSTGSPGANVKIELLKAGVVNVVISSSTANDGSYSWTMPSTQTLGTDYKVRITSTSNSAYTDSSNNNFAITSSAASAHIYVEHTYRGDLVVDIGVGSTSSPLWSSRVWNRQGGSADNLDLTVDLSAATAYLPPSNTYTWFLKVYDAASGDQGRITQFSITYQGVTYSSTDVPVSVTDLKTSYAYIPSPAQAHIYIQHTYRGDLVVDIGVGSTSTPLWSKRIWNGTGGSADNLDLYVDLSAAATYLPPSATYTWWVKVYDRAAGDTGKITTFTITYQSKTYASPNVPLAISDLKTSYAYIKG